MEDLREIRETMNELEESLRIRLFPVLKDYYKFIYDKDFYPELNPTKDCILSIKLIDNDYCIISFEINNDWDILNIPFKFIEDYEKDNNK